MDATLYQYLAAKQTGSKPQFKFDPVSMSSEASLLKDLISTDNQTRFSQQNLNELKVTFHSRGINSQYFRQSPTEPSSSQTAAQGKDNNLSVPSDSDDNVAQAMTLQHFGAPSVVSHKFSNSFHGGPKSMTSNTMVAASQHLSNKRMELFM